MYEVFDRLTAPGVREALASMSGDMAVLQQRIESTHRRLGGLDDKCKAGVLARPAYLETRRQVFGMLEQLRRVSETDPSNVKVGEQMTVETLATRWVSSRIDRRRELVNALLEYVDVHLEVRTMQHRRQQLVVGRTAPRRPSLDPGATRSPSRGRRWPGWHRP